MSAKILQFPAKKKDNVLEFKPSPYTGNYPSTEITLQERIERIKTSINRVNELLLELKSLTPPTK